ncbi:hypothetical protein N8652_00505 [bacterium]|nr:hypothetical protein [bacterium]
MKAWARRDLSAMTGYLITMPESGHKTLIAGTLVKEQDGANALSWADALVSIPGRLGEPDRYGT